LLAEYYSLLHIIVPISYCLLKTLATSLPTVLSGKDYNRAKARIANPRQRSLAKPFASSAKPTDRRELAAAKSAPATAVYSKATKDLYMKYKKNRVVLHFNSIRQ